MPLAPSSRAVLRIAAIGVAALVLGAAAYELPPRMELDAGPNPRDLVGTYEELPLNHATNPNHRRTFLHLYADGRMRREIVRLDIGDSTLSVGVRPMKGRTLRWSVRHASERGAVASVFARPQLCMHTAKNVYCTPFERDARTGDVTFREEPTVVHRERTHRMVRLRSGALPD